ncbi:Signal transduction histidine kinase [Anaerobranca californiensis DSM 14826]|jgi:signal transduction histidine kinase|uniref:histidine kinase n=1 Tax=Anaerobranca californiensis DSM 14826 TaxID=1120989 RepID=A0A1M6P4J8_9FIRM|nr:HAMP domain-containing sensor histidine kinase [Anaerobranca californiensis]SHK02813.1 Signal transduction histidine kinase [Anaerobranca californiensis DSM 14826]
MFISIKWKIAGVFVAIFIIIMVITNLIISKTLESYYLNQRQVTLLKTANIIATTSTIDGNFDSNKVKEIIANYLPSLEMRIISTDLDGRVLADSFLDSNLEGKILNQREIEAAIKGKSVWQKYNLPQRGWVMYSAVPIILDGAIIGTVFISSSIEDIKTAISYIKNTIVAVSLVSGLVITFVSIILANNLVKPIEKLTKVSKEMGKGQFSKPVEITSNDEIGILGQSFNRMAEQLQRIEETRLKFLGDISHDLKTPLATIKALAQSLENEDNIEIYREFLADIVSEVNRMNLIVNNIIQFNKISDRTLPLIKTEFVFKDIVEESIHSIKTLANGKDIKIKFFDYSQEGIFLGDKEKIKSMIINLLENAVKYSFKDGLIIVTLECKENYYKLKVKDNGRGIPEEDLPHIFERFYRVDKTRSSKTGGAGIGLSIVKMVVDLHKGKIEVNSKLGEGTEFILEFPRLNY